MADVRLRYFECRSRGQALRFALADAGIDFDDHRIPVEELARFRATAHQPEVGGPFASLPVLEWHGSVVAQTLAIARFLASKLDEPAPDGEMALRDMIANAAHLDMQAPYSQLLWLPADVPAAKLRAAADGLLGHLARRSEQVHALMPAIGFLGGTRPCVADHLLYESLGRARAVFGARFDERLEALPRLAAFVLAMEGRPALRALLDGGRVPFQVTASPSEPRLRARLGEEAP